MERHLRLGFSGFLLTGTEAGSPLPAGSGLPGVSEGARCHVCALMQDPGRAASCFHRALWLFYLSLQKYLTPSASLFENSVH